MAKSQSIAILIAKNILQYFAILLEPPLCLRQLYRLIRDWKGKLYIGLTLQCDYINRTSDLSVSGYVERALQQFCSPGKHKL